MDEHHGSSRFDLHRSWIAREFGLSDYVPLQDKDLDALERVGEWRELPIDAPLFRQATPAEAVYLIRRGSVGLWRDHRRPTVHLADVGEGKVLGDLEVLTGADYYSTAIASSPVTVLRIPQDGVHEVLVTNPRLALRWLVAALRQFEQSQQRVAQLLLNRVDAKIAVFLLDEADDSGSLHVTHQKLADLLGIERATASRVLGRFREAELIESRRGTMRILDSDGLLTVANGLWPQLTDDIPVGAGS